MAHPARFWDRIAARYARSPVPSEEVYERKLALTRPYLSPGAEVLEVGCGPGTTALRHAPHVGHVRAVDVSAKMLDIARDRAREAGVANVTFEQGDTAALDLAPARYDAVLALSILHLLPDWRATLPRLAATLKPGGVLVSSTACLGDGQRWMAGPLWLGAKTGLLPPVQVFTRAALRDAIRDTGLDIVEDWHPAKGAALFLIARKPASETRRGHDPR